MINTATKMLKVAKVSPERELQRSRFDVSFGFTNILLLHAVDGYTRAGN